MADLLIIRTNEQILLWSTYQIGFDKKLAGYNMELFEIFVSISNNCIDMIHSYRRNIKKMTAESPALSRGWKQLLSSPETS